MATKVKGLLKGLRYISQMFDEKDDDIQIGFPTDVKHVAHIGWEGPSTNSTPTWMNEFKASPEVSSAAQLAVKELSSQDIHKTSLAVQELVQRNEIPRSRRHSSDEPGGSPTKKSSDGIKKHSRRHRSKEGAMDSPSREAREGSSRRARRSQNNSLGSESPSQEPPGIPKQRRKKGSSEGESTRSSRRSSRSKGQNSMTDISLEGSEHGYKSGESPMHPVLAEKKGSEEFAGGNIN